MWRGDGTLGWTFSRAVPLLDERGEIVEWFGAASDVTARKEAETKVAESEARYRAIVDSAASGIIVIDEAGIIQSANPAADAMFGYEPNELVGANVAILMPPEQARAHDEPHRRLQTHRREQDHRHRPGGGRPPQGAVRPSKPSSPSPNGGICAADGSSAA